MRISLWVACGALTIVAVAGCFSSSDFDASENAKGGAPTGSDSCLALLTCCTSMSTASAQQYCASSAIALDKNSAANQALCTSTLRMYQASGQCGAGAAPTGAGGMAAAGQGGANVGGTSGVAGSGQPLGMGGSAGSLDVCQECVEQSVSSPVCANATTACDANAQCVSFGECYNGCADDAGCQANCWSAFPYGAIPAWHRTQCGCDQCGCCPAFPVSTLCMASQDCSSGFCQLASGQQFGWCEAACTADAQCANTEAAGVCVPSTVPGEYVCAPECANAADCVAFGLDWVCNLVVGAEGNAVNYCAAPSG